MNPIYRFIINKNTPGENGVIQEVHPNYPDSLALNFDKDSNEEYFRQKVSAAFTFYGPDYDFLMQSSTINTSYTLTIDISKNGGQTWTEYWRGMFWKTDCEFNADDKTIKVTPAVNDRYTNILNGIEKEFDLIKLSPEIRPVKAWRRPVIQIYMAGRSTIGCFLGGMYWEQDCDAESDHNTLEGTYKFRRNILERTITADILPASGSIIIDTQHYYGKAPTNSYTNTEYEGGFDTAYKLVYTYWYTGGGEEPMVHHYKYEIVYNNVALYRYETSSSEPNPPELQNLILTSVSDITQGTRAKMGYVDTGVYMRCICDVDSIGGTPTYNIPSEDITANTQNYRKVLAIEYPNSIIVSPRIDTTPTQWGLYQPGYYYQYPSGYNESQRLLEPVARNTWGDISIWFLPDSTLYAFEETARKEFTIKGAYPIHSALSVLLGAIDSNILHDTGDSTFLYANNPISGILSEPCIVPKSNIIYSNNDQPAQKALITLRQIFNMLRDFYRCYWYIDDNNRLKIEHIKYFNQGGSYSTTPVVGKDLTNIIQPQNGKTWAFAQDSWDYDKPDTAGCYEFSWMDDSTLPFRGYSIDILNNYVDKTKVESITISQFSSDIDYIMVNASEISKDGFVLLQPIMQSNEYVLPFITLYDNTKTYILQNGYCSFFFGRRYYNWDMPAEDYQYGSTIYTAEGTKKLRRQTVRFPMQDEPNLQRLIKTNLGNGKIDKITLSLLSRDAKIELLYDTE